MNFFYLFLFFLSSCAPLNIEPIPLIRSSGSSPETPDRTDIPDRLEIRPDAVDFCVVFHERRTSGYGYQGVVKCLIQNQWASLDFSGEEFPENCGDSYLIPTFPEVQIFKTRDGKLTLGTWQCRWRPLEKVRAYTYDFTSARWTLVFETDPVTLEIPATERYSQFGPLFFPVSDGAAFGLVATLWPKGDRDGIRAFRVNDGFVAESLNLVGFPLSQRLDFVRHPEFLNSSGRQFVYYGSPESTVFELKQNRLERLGSAISFSRYERPLMSSLALHKDSFFLAIGRILGGANGGGDWHSDTQVYKLNGTQWGLVKDFVPTGIPNSPFRPFLFGTQDDLRIVVGETYEREVTSTNYFRESVRLRVFEKSSQSDSEWLPLGEPSPVTLVLQRPEFEFDGTRLRLHTLKFDSAINAYKRIVLAWSLEQGFYQEGPDIAVYPVESRWDWEAPFVYRPGSVSIGPFNN